MVINNERITHLLYNYFMTEKIIELSYKLKEAINHDERIIHLNEVEKRMNECEEVMGLSYKKDMALDRYNEMLKY